MKSNHTTFHVLLLTVELRIPHAHSLKEKRGALRPLRDRVRNQFNAAVAELDFQDQWQHAVLGVCLLGNDRRQLECERDRLGQLCADAADIDVIDIGQDWL